MRAGSRGLLCRGGAAAYKPRKQLSVGGGQAPAPARRCCSWGEGPKGLVSWFTPVLGQPCRVVPFLLQSPLRQQLAGRECLEATRCCPFPALPFVSASAPSGALGPMLTPLWPGYE